MGEVLDEIDLLFRERTHFGAIDRDHTNQFPLLKHRHGKETAQAGFDDGDYAGITLDIGLVRPEVRNLEHLFANGDAGERNARMVAQFEHWFSLQPLDETRRTMHRDRTKGIVLVKE